MLEKARSCWRNPWAAAPLCSWESSHIGWAPPSGPGWFSLLHYSTVASIMRQDILIEWAPLSGPGLLVFSLLHYSIVASKIRQFTPLSARVIFLLHCKIIVASDTAYFYRMGTPVWAKGDTPYLHCTAVASNTRQDIFIEGAPLSGPRLFSLLHSSSVVTKWDRMYL